MQSWIQSLSNRKLEPIALTTDMVGPIEEIAHSLAGEYRFTRQTAKRYTVAEHCVRGSRLLSAAFAPAFLLHELSEVYLPDIAGPLKPFVRVSLPDDDDHSSGLSMSWVDLERHHTQVILASLGLGSLEPLITSPEVKAMDMAMLAAEKRDLCGPEPEDWNLTAPPADVYVGDPWSPQLAEQEFLLSFRQFFSAPRAER